MIELATPKRLLIGRPRSTRELDSTLLPKFLALPVFSSDPISSVAYATEAALAVLVATSLTAAHLVFPLSIGIAAFMVIVVLSYVQGVKAYSSSGGSYVFAKENLGTLPALVAGASLLVDYVLTVAVSVAAGVFALTSAVPGLESHRVALSLGCIVLLTLGNLRGVRESGLLFAFPTSDSCSSCTRRSRSGSGSAPSGTCPQATVPHPLANGAGAADCLRGAQGVRLRLGRADRHGVDLERRHRLQASAGAERRADAARSWSRSPSRSSSASRGSP